MRAVAEEYPDITLFCYFVNSINARAPRLDHAGYGLLPAFADGWLDAAPAGVTIVDGCESAYRYNSVNEYLEAAVQIKGDCQRLVAPENRAKYRAQVQASFGIYVDAYWNPPSSPWHIDGKGGARIERLRENVGTAVRVADEYVWIYGEQFRWWPTPNKRVKEPAWPEALPGIKKVLGFARDPIGYAREAGKGAARERPDGWGSWQPESSKGTLVWEKTSGRATGAAHGCFIQSVDVKPGDHFAIQARRRLQGKGDAWILIRWKTADDKWTLEDHDQPLRAAGPREQWSEIFGTVVVPNGVGKLAILLMVADQSAPEDIAWFDEVHLSSLD